MKNKSKIKPKIWRRLFLNISVIFLIFAVCISVASSIWFDDYYIMHEQGQLRLCARTVYELDLSDRKAAETRLLEIENFYNNVRHELQMNACDLYSIGTKESFCTCFMINEFDQFEVFLYECGNKQMYKRYYNI